MIDLIKNIKTKPLVMHRNINNINELVEDVLRKMLVVDPKKRIEWEGIFSLNFKKLYYFKIKTL